MAILNQTQANQIAKGENLPNKDKLKKASVHDERAQLHSLAANEKHDLKYYDKFISWIGNIISREKLETFKYLQSIPFETSEVTEEIYREVEKIFDAQDRYIRHSFTDEGMDDDFNAYLKDIKDSKFWRTTGMELLKSYLNSYIVVDFPSLQYYIDKGMEIPERPEPYYYPVHSDKIEAVELCDDQDDRIEFIAFTDPKDPNKFNIFDDEQVFIYEIKSGEKRLIYNEPHGFSQCPVTSFYHIPFNQQNKVQKQGLASKLFGSLDWLQMKITMAKNSELYSGFPITVSYEEECDYTDPQGNQCEGGKILTERKVGFNSEKLEAVIEDCPRCSNNKNLGAGTHKIAPARADKDDPDLLEAMKFIQIPVDQLKRLEDSIDHDKRSIKNSMVGLLMDPNGQAMNSDQIMAGHEDRQSILDQVRENFETTHKFVIERMGEIRYGDKYQGSMINYGNKYFLFSTQQMIDQYLKYKKEGLPEFLLDELRESIIDHKYKSNPDGRNRMKILSRLMPYKNQSIEDLNIMKQIDPSSIDPELFKLKQNFSYLIDRFEREMMPIQLVLPFATMERRINFINAKLLDYVREQKTIQIRDAGSTEVIPD